MRCAGLLFTLGLAVSSSSAQASDVIDLGGWLRRPGVRLLAVVVAPPEGADVATKKGRARRAAPGAGSLDAWRRLRAERGAEGLEVVVVRENASGPCALLGWPAEAVLCVDPAERRARLGPGGPEVFLWSFTGELLARGKTPAELAGAIDVALRASPAVRVQVGDVEAGLPSEHDAQAAADLRGQLRELATRLLTDRRRLRVALTAEERATAKDLVAERPNPATATCPRDAALPSLSILRISLAPRGSSAPARLTAEASRSAAERDEPFAPKGAPGATLVLALEPASAACAAVRVEEPYEPKRFRASVTAGVDGLLATLPLRLALPAGADADVTSPGMVAVPAGAFWMGCAPRDRACADDERPGRRVELEAFEIDKTEVTKAAYAACVRAKKCRVPPVWAKGAADSAMVDVSWQDAVAYCRWAGKRLPTEAEWEKAARGAEGWIYPWGDHPPPCARRASTCVPEDNRFLETIESPFGVLDVAGGVWEWVADRYGPFGVNDSSRSAALREASGPFGVNDSSRSAALREASGPFDPARDPRGASDGAERVLRGGNSDPERLYGRVGARQASVPEATSPSVGFRCAR